MTVSPPALSPFWHHTHAFFRNISCKLELTYLVTAQHYNKITILLFSSKISGVVTVGRIMARIVGGHVTTDSCITEIMYKSFTKVNNNLAVGTSVLPRSEIICDAVRRLVYYIVDSEILKNTQ
jgi:hypothetical protein